MLGVGVTKWHGGKGSKSRPIKNREQFDAEYDRIFGRKVTPKHGATQVHKNKKKKSRVDLKKELRDNLEHGND